MSLIEKDFFSERDKITPRGVTKNNFRGLTMWFLDFLCPNSGEKATVGLVFFVSARLFLRKIIWLRKVFFFFLAKYFPENNLAGTKSVNPRGVSYVLFRRNKIPRQKNLLQNFLPKHKSHNLGHKKTVFVIFYSQKLS